MMMASSRRTGFSYPKRHARWLLRTPVLLCRLGLGGLLSPTPLLILTTRGRRSGRLRYTPLEYRRHGSKFYVVSVGGRSAHWVRNLREYPYATLKVGRRAYSVRAELVEQPSELLTVLYMFRRMLALLDEAPEHLTLRGLADQTDRFTVVRFDTLDSAPLLPPVPADRAWVWPALAAVGLVVMALLEVWRSGRRGV